MGILEVPESWKNAEDEGLFTPEIKRKTGSSSFVKNIQAKVNAQEGKHFRYLHSQNMSTVLHHSGTAADENVVLQIDIPVNWKSENCIQCNRCAYASRPHEVIRSGSFDRGRSVNAPEGLETIDMIGTPGFEIHNDVSAMTYRLWFCVTYILVRRVKSTRNGKIMEQQMQENRGFLIMEKKSCKT